MEMLLMKRFKFIDLFSGIGGFHTAFKEIGGECVFASEIDKFAKQAYTTLHGLEPHGDITKIDAKDIPDHDVIAAGFPCQSFSVAGKRGGFEDARGTLFFEVARIADEKKPKILLLENVKGLVGHDKGKTLDTIVKTLNDIGYRVDFEVLNSKYFGVPQNRERIFIVAIREDLIVNETWNIVGNNVVAKGKKRISGYDDVKTFNFDFPKNETVTKRLVDVLEDAVDEKYYLDEDKTCKLVVDLKGSNSDVKVVGNASRTGYNSHNIHDPEGISPTIAARDYKGAKMVAEGLPIKEATKKGYAMAKEGDAVNVSFPSSKTRRGRVGKDGQAQTLEASGVNQGVVVPRINNFYAKDNFVVTENKFLDEPFEYDYVYTDAEIRQVGENIIITNQDNSQCEVLKPLENGIFETIKIVHDINEIEKLESIESKKEMGRMGTQAVETYIFNNVKEGATINAYNKAVDNSGVSPTITTRPEGFKTAILPITKTLRIRKLTPKECWRLQGFTDDQHDAVESAGISNSQRYKQAGNAVTINVIEAIGTRLLPYL